MIAKISMQQKKDVQDRIMPDRDRSVPVLYNDVPTSNTWAKYYRLSLSYVHQDEGWCRLSIKDNTILDVHLVAFVIMVSDM